ncbi:MAG TPA: MFS transporter, partial [Paracoccus sp.]|nr:MFS transporter [Paracoccus sp. (in: a-proteobacteria)]
MSAAPVLSAPNLRVAAPGWLTAAIIIATVMQVLDTTIANVALPHMAASLGATQEESTWVLTSYIVAAAIATPLTGWAADRF